MLVTEDQAEALWCPAVRYTEGTEDGGSNRFQSGGKLFTSPKACRCLASKCMWWRWHDPEHETLLFADGEVAEAKRRGWEFGESSNCSLAKGSRPAAQRRGYCGMAGTP